MTACIKQWRLVERLPAEHITIVEYFDGEKAISLNVGWPSDEALPQVVARHFPTDFANGQPAGHDGDWMAVDEYVPPVSRLKKLPITRII